MTLFGADGAILAEWCEKRGPGAGAIILDSREIRARFRLPEFCGQLFLHVVGAAGHDVVKYALDTFGDGGADPATAAIDRFPRRTTPMHGRRTAMPACRRLRPASRVVLWVQNSHPIPIPPGAIGLNPMGDER